MVFNNFEQLIVRIQSSGPPKRVAVAAAHDEHSLEAIFKAKRSNIILPLLIGDKLKIMAIAESMGENLDEAEVITIADDREAAETSVALIREGRADFIMKGKLQTADLLKAVVNKEKGLRTGRVMSHMAIFQIPGYHKLLAVTDGGMSLYPTLEEKKQIIENGVMTLKNIGYDNPKVAVLAAVETVNPKMQETLDAAELKKMYISGEIEGCTIEGPISYDLVMDAESAHIKGYESPIVGDADMLIVPNIAAGNILGKALVFSAKAKMAGFILGASVPIVLTSRGASTEEKYLSLVLSAAASISTQKNGG